MPNGNHTQGGRRDAPSRYEDRSYNEGRERARSSGGRSESLGHDRDREQQRAGYAPHDWERSEESYRTVHSEPDWDPTRLSLDRRGFSDEAGTTTPHDGERRARYGYDDSREIDQRRIRQGAPSADSYQEASGSRHSSPAFEQEYRQHAQSLASEIGNAGRRLIGKIKGVVRNPKNYTRSDERIREDVCDRLSVSHELDPREIEVTVAGGEVTLAGTVSDRRMKFAAEELAADVPGVHDVHNQLRVNRPAPVQTSSNVAINSREAERTGKNIGRS